MVNAETQKAEGRPIVTVDRQKAVTESLKQITRVSRFADRKKGIRSYQSHIKDDPWLPVLFLICFVVPSLAGAVYFGLIASDRYVTETRFAIRPMTGTADKATSDAVGTNAGVPGQVIAQDTLITYAYVDSRPMVESIEAQLPIREWFGRDSIDYFSRVDANKSVEKFLRYWKRRVAIDVESSTGILLLTVEAFDPDESLAIAQAVMKEAERMVNALSAAARNDAVAESTRELKLAEERLTNARLAVNELRNREGVLDAVKSNESNLKLVSELRANRINLAVQLAVGERDLGPGSRQIVDIKQRMKDLDSNIARIEQSTAGQDSEKKRLLSDALTRFEALDHDRKTAEKYYEMVRSAYERSRIIAARQVESFSPIIQAVKAGSSTEPRRVLMISLITAGAAVLSAAVLFARKLMA